MDAEVKTKSGRLSFSATARQLIKLEELLQREVDRDEQDQVCVLSCLEVLRTAFSVSELLEGMTEMLEDYAHSCRISNLPNQADYWLNLANSLRTLTTEEYEEE